jgi:hypothetical protein
MNEKTFVMLGTMNKQLVLRYMQHTRKDIELKIDAKVAQFFPQSSHFFKICAISSNSLFVVYAALDNSLILYNVKMTEQVRSFVGHTDQACISQDSPSFSGDKLCIFP